MTPPLKYKKGYRYWVAEDFELDIGARIRPAVAGGNSFVELSAAGVLITRRGYAWDGASGPAINTENWRTASLVHDGLYQLIREGVLTMDQRKDADDLMRDILVGKQMWTPRVVWSHLAVRQLGETFMRNTPDAVLVAP
jgi:hypothetical protein